MLALVISTRILFSNQKHTTTVNNPVLLSFIWKDLGNSQPHGSHEHPQSSEYEKWCNQRVILQLQSTCSRTANLSEPLWLMTKKIKNSTLYQAALYQWDGCIIWLAGHIICTSVHGHYRSKLQLLLSLASVMLWTLSISSLMVLLLLFHCHTVGLVLCVLNVVFRTFLEHPH
jgi:hypothetical protein